MTRSSHSDARSIAPSAAAGHDGLGQPQTHDPDERLFPARCPDACQPGPLSTRLRIGRLKYFREPGNQVFSLASDVVFRNDEYVGRTKRSATD